jgi:L-ascorbate metabolism protein UlaG (beta-lactamase superfamily)
MKIRYLAHSSFLITSGSGTRIVTDPYTVNEGTRYKPISETADIVTISHGHGDHNNVASVKGKPQVVRDSAEVKGIKIKAVPTFHDASGGKERGRNTVFCLDVDGVRVCHCGDLGHKFTAEQLKEIGKVDVLIIPVGGFFTIDARTAGEVMGQVGAAVTIPMHYKTEKVDYPIAGVEEFVKGKQNVTRVDGGEVELKAGQLPKDPQIMVLKPSL